MARLLRLVLVTSFVVAACSVRIAPSSPPTATGTAAPSATNGPVATDAPEPNRPNLLTADGDGVALTVELDRTEVAAGGEVRVRATFQNRRPVPVDYSVSCGTAPRMLVSVLPPMEPLGRGWPGVAGIFKEYALTEGFGPGGVPAAGAATTGVPALPCREVEEWERLLPAGASLIANFVWKAEIVEGVAAPTGDVEFQVSVGYDRQNEPPENPGIGPPVPPVPVGQANTAVWIPAYKEVAVRGTLTVTAAGRPILGAGEAVDRALASREFVGWLETVPRGTWSNANLFLEAGFQSTLGFEVGPHWSVELFVEPRQWGILYVDPWSGELVREEYCEVPCDR